MTDEVLNEDGAPAIPQWSTWEEGPVRDRAFPYSTEADYQGQPCVIRYGAFLGWRFPPEDLDMAIASLPIGALSRLNLLDIEHQGGGHMCIVDFWIARPVKITTRYHQFVANLCRDYFHAKSGYLSRGTEQEVADYRARCAAVGLTAERVFNNGHADAFRESIYPLDATDSNLQAFVVDPLGAMSALRPLLDNERLRQMLRLVVLADNSD
jgi:hypothetical protein